MICDHCGEYWAFSDRECPNEPHPRKGDIRWKPVQFNGRWYAEEQVCEHVYARTKTYTDLVDPEDQYIWKTTGRLEIGFPSEDFAEKWCKSRTLDSDPDEDALLWREIVLWSKNDWHIGWWDHNQPWRGFYISGPGHLDHPTIYRNDPPEIGYDRPEFLPKYVRQATERLAVDLQDEMKKPTPGSDQ